MTFDPQKNDGRTDKLAYRGPTDRRTGGPANGHNLLQGSVAASNKNVFTLYKLHTYLPIDVNKLHPCVILK